MVWPGGRGAKTVCLKAVIITDDGDIGNGRCTVPEGGFLPVVSELCWLEEKHIRLRTQRGLRHQHRQFTNTGTRAGTARVGQHDQGRAVGRGLEAASGGPLCRRMRRHPWTVFKVPQDPQAGADNTQPEHTAGKQQHLSLAGLHPFFHA